MSQGLKYVLLTSWPLLQTPKLQDATEVSQHLHPLLQKPGITEYSKFSSFSNIMCPHIKLFQELHRKIQYIAYIQGIIQNDLVNSFSEKKGTY